MNHTESIGSMLRHWSAQRPDQVGIAVHDVESLTFAEWFDESSRLAGALASIPVNIGDRVGYLGKNTARWGVLLAAASLLRAAGVPLNWRLSRAELTEVLQDAEPAAVVVEREFLPLLGREPIGDNDLHISIGHDLYPLQSWLASTSARAHPADRIPQPQDTALVVYTSGTSGRAKGVELPNRAITFNLRSTAPWHIQAGDTVLVPAPNFHVSGTGWIFYCLGLGATSLYLPDIRPEVVLDLLSSQRINHSLTVPAVVQMLVQHPSARGRDYSALKTLIYGGSPMSPTIAEAARELFDCDLIQSYGMTETCGPITFLSPQDHRDGGHRLSSAGRAVPEVEVAIFDPVTGTRCAPGAKGEVWTRSDMLLSGYLNKPEELSAVMAPGGWFRTGDGGYFDEDGYLFLRDRVKDMIISGGENVYPVEVENRLMSHPGIRDVAVIGVPHATWGETVKAVVVTTDLELTEQALIDYCRDGLAHYKCPTSIDFVTELPRNPSGKVLKRLLRAPYWTTHDDGADTLR